jgi:hypothetical protein
MDLMTTTLTESVPMDAEPPVTPPLPDPEEFLVSVFAWD